MISWLERIRKLEPSVQESLLHETAVTFFRGEIPSDLAILEGNVNFRFGLLGLTPNERIKLEEEFSSTGVIVPNTPYRIRFIYPWSVVELADGTETVSLPLNWREVMTKN